MPPVNDRALVGCVPHMHSSNTLQTMRYLLALVAIAGCGPGTEPYPDPLEIQWEGENIRFAADGSVPVCGATQRFLDDYLGTLGDIAEATPMDKVSYYAIPEDTTHEICRNGGVTGCALPGRAYASEAVVVHELVHTVRFASVGFPYAGSRLFEEGLAELYDARLARFNRGPEPFGTIQIPSDLVGFLESGVDDGVPASDRVLASFYLSALADWYGDRPVWDFVTQTGELRDGRPLREIFEENFPESFDDFNALFSMERLVCSEWRKTRHLLECEQDGPDIDASFDTLILRPSSDGMMDCASPDIIGPRSGEMWVTRTFDVTEPIPLAFVGAASSEDPDEELALRELDPDNRIHVRLTKCDAGCFVPGRVDGIYGDGDSTLDLSDPINDLSPGRYLVRFARPYDDPGDSAFFISSEPDWPFPE